MQMTGRWPHEAPMGPLRQWTGFNANSSILPGDFASRLMSGLDPPSSLPCHWIMPSQSIMQIAALASETSRLIQARMDALRATGRSQIDHERRGPDPIASARA